MRNAVRFAWVLWVCALVAGCASTRAHVAEKGRSLRDVREFFVLRNLKDNHGIDERIVRALKARGFTAESGPITLMPESAQAVIVYEDRWAWDFGDHLVYLRLGARDPREYLPFVTVEYSKYLEFTTQTDAVVGRMVGELLAAGR